MVEALRSDPFIPNTVIMGGKEARSKGKLSLISSFFPNKEPIA